MWGILLVVIKVTLDNRYAKFHTTPDIQVKIKRFFRHLADQDTLDHSSKYASGDWDGYVNFMRWSKVASGLFLLQKLKIERVLGVLQVADRRVYPAFRPLTTTPGAWMHQSAAVRRMVANSNGGGLLIAATASGKTDLVGMYFQLLMGQGLFVVDELFLLEQSRVALAKVLGEEVGVVGKGLFEPKRITCATIQTLHKYRDDPRFLAWFKRVDVMVIDEVHVALNRRNLDVVELANPKAVFGLTATLQMEKIDVRMRAIELCGPPIFRYTILEGQRDNILSGGKVLSIPFESLWQFGGDYQAAVVCNVRRNRLIQSVVEQGVQAGRIVATMVERRQHLSILHEQLRHINHRVLSGLVPADERKRIIQQMRSGQLPLLLASRVFFKGVDVPNLDMIVDATGAPNENGAIQRFGRGVRKAEGKQDLVYVDITDKIGTTLTDASTFRIGSWRKIGIPVTELPNGDLDGLLGKPLQRVG